MSKFPIDLRSDTVTRPSPALREAMAKAPVGDDVFGEDPSVNALEARCAALFSMEAALFVPSGTMANQLAIHAYCRPGDMVLCGDGAHSLLYEGGGAEAITGVQIRTTPSAIVTPEEADALYRGDDDVHSAETTLVMIENTHNRSGGVPWSMDQLDAISAWAKERGVPLHMDGARLMNALIATGQSSHEVGSRIDSLSICLSKGLGCPVGSVLIGDHRFIHRARRGRKRMGGGMRQCGILAAGGLFALERHVERLAEDHRRAALLAEGWAKIPGVGIPKRPQTNLVYFDIEGGEGRAKAVVEGLKEEGVWMIDVGPDSIRAVTHLDVSEDDIHRAIGALSKVMSTLGC